MNNYLNKHKRSITRQILAVFILSWFSLIGQATAHSFMMAEMQQHQAMGHNMPSHCQPVFCETVIAQDNQNNTGIGSVALIDLSLIPAGLVIAVLVPELTESSLNPPDSSGYSPPPLERTSILQI